MNRYFTCSLFLKTASGFNVRCSDELIFPTSNFELKLLRMFQHVISKI